MRLERDAGFRRIVRDFESYGDADIDVPAGLEATLRGYQEDGFRWLGTLERLGFGGILADDMGLGKTLQVIAHVLAQKETGRGGCTLVVCPASLVYQLDEPEISQLRARPCSRGRARHQGRPGASSSAGTRARTSW